MEGRFFVFTTPGFDRELKKIVKKDRDVITTYEKALGTLFVDPLNLKKIRDIKKLAGVKQSEGEWRIRMGNYRIRYDVIHNRVILHTIKNRKDVYK